MNDITKKLQKLVKNRKTKIVVIERGSVKQYSRPTSSSTDYSDYSYEDN